MPSNHISPARTDWFVNDRFGMFIHFGLSAIPARDLSWPMSWEKIPTAQWRKYFAEFNPDLAGPEEWVKMAAKAGCRYAVLTVKHHEGFCLWDSKLTDYTSVNAPLCCRDLTREFIDACACYNVKPGLYYSLIDWDHPDYPAADLHHPERENQESLNRPRCWERYVEYMHGQVREILSNYGKIDVLWLDFSYGDMSGEKWKADQLMEMVRSLQPDILVDNRLVAGHEDPAQNAKHGDFATPEQVLPAEGVFDAEGKPVVWESCMTIGESWGYNRKDKNFKSPTQSIRMLIECVAKGGNLLMNIGPNARGRVRPQETEVMDAFANWLQINGAAVFGAGRAVVAGKILAKPQWGWYTRRGNTLFAILTERPPGPLALLGLGGLVSEARFLHDGSEISMQRTWNSVRGDQHAILNFNEAELPDPIATVVAMTIND